MAHDGGQDDRARAHLHTAYRLASAAENDALTGNVCASMSHLAGQLHAPADAVRIAEVGLGRAKHASGAAVLVSRLHAMRARGLAMRGDRRACVTALAEAERVLSRVGGEQPADWIAQFDEASLASESALCLRQIGELSEAQRQAERVIELRKGDRIRSRAFGQITLAGVLADAGRLDEAALIGLAVCELLPTLSSARVRSRLDRLAKTLQRRSSVSEVDRFLACLAAHSEEQLEDVTWPV
jgi:hypothetical protein